MITKAFEAYMNNNYYMSIINGASSTPPRDYSDTAKAVVSKHINELMERVKPPVTVFWIVKSGTVMTDTDAYFRDAVTVSDWTLMIGCRDDELLVYFDARERKTERYKIEVRGRHGTYHDTVPEHLIVTTLRRVIKERMKAQRR